MVFHGHRVSVLQDEKVLWRNGVMVAQHCECIDASKLYPEQWVRWYVLCYVYFITMETQWAREADAGNSEVEGAGKVVLAHKCHGLSPLHQKKHPL